MVVLSHVLNMVVYFIMYSGVGVRHPPGKREKGEGKKEREKKRGKKEREKKEREKKRGKG